MPLSSSTPRSISLVEILLLLTSLVSVGGGVVMLLLIFCLWCHDLVASVPVNDMQADNFTSAIEPGVQPDHHERYQMLLIYHCC